MKKIPLSQTFDHRNNYYLACDKVDKQQKYSICLMMISLGRENNWEKAFESCKPFLRDGTCPAMAMRKEEVAAGESLYFEADQLELFQKKKAVREEEERSHTAELLMNKIDKSGASYQRGFTGQSTHFNTSASKTAQKPARQPTAPTAASPDDSLQAQLVNKLATEKGGKKEGEITVVAAGKNAGKSKIKPLPGEKPMDFIKRLNAAKE